MGEAGRTLGWRMTEERAKGNQQQQWEEHISVKRHKIKEEQVKVLASEPNTWWRKIREAVQIRTHKP